MEICYFCFKQITALIFPCTPPRGRESTGAGKNAGAAGQNCGELPPRRRGGGRKNGAAGLVRGRKRAKRTNFLRAAACGRKTGRGTHFRTRGRIWENLSKFYKVLWRFSLFFTLSRGRQGVDKPARKEYNNARNGRNVRQDPQPRKPPSQRKKTLLHGHVRI